MKRFDVDLIIHTMFPCGQDTKHVGGYYIVRRIIPAVPHFIWGACHPVTVKTGPSYLVGCFTSAPFTCIHEEPKA